MRIGRIISRGTDVKVSLPRCDNVGPMNGPLLVSLLPPEKLLDSAGAVPVYEPFIAFLLLIGFLLSLFLRHPGR